MKYTAKEELTKPITVAKENLRKMAGDLNNFRRISTRRQRGDAMDFTGINSRIKKKINILKLKCKREGERELIKGMASTRHRTRHSSKWFS